MKKQIFIIPLAASLNLFAQSTFQITLQQAKNGDAKAQNNVAAYYREAGDCESA